MEKHCVVCGEYHEGEMDHWVPDEAAEELIKKMFWPAFLELNETMIARDAKLLELAGHLDLARKMFAKMRDLTFEKMGEK